MDAPWSLVILPQLCQDDGRFDHQKTSGPDSTSVWLAKPRKRMNPSPQTWSSFFSPRAFLANIGARIERQAPCVRTEDPVRSGTRHGIANACPHRALAQSERWRTFPSRGRSRQVRAKSSMSCKALHEAAVRTSKLAFAGHPKSELDAFSPSQRIVGSGCVNLPNMPASQVDSR
jgi:hypothetical protein